jgi:hypothetical protein
MASTYLVHTPAHEPFEHDTRLGSCVPFAFHPPLLLAGGTLSSRHQRPLAWNGENIFSAPSASTKSKLSLYFDVKELRYRAPALSHVVRKNTLRAASCISKQFKQMNKKLQVFM